MRDLIDREATMDEIGKQKTYTMGYYEDTLYLDANDVGSVLASMPSAQPERKKGEWIQNDNGTYSCSLCQSWIPEEQYCYARYCLYCGADMRGEQDE